MVKRKLPPKYEDWLFLHYPDKTNKELAEELSRMLRRENQKQLDNFKLLLKEDFCDTTMRVIQRKIDSLERFSGISESSVKRYARILHCPKKSSKHLMICNQEKANVTNTRRWLKKAERVEHIMEWLRTFEEKDIRYCIINNDGQLRSIRVSINKFNRIEGYNRGVYLAPQYFPGVGLLRVTASLYEHKLLGQHTPD